MERERGRERKEREAHTQVNVRVVVSLQGYVGCEALPCRFLQSNSSLSHTHIHMYTNSV